MKKGLHYFFFYLTFINIGAAFIAFIIQATKVSRILYDGKTASGEIGLLWAIIGWGAFSHFFNYLADLTEIKKPKN